MSCTGKERRATPALAARKIAGHANAARGEPILWIIGLDEDDHQVTGASDVELADWWAQATAAFDEQIVPGSTGLMVPVSPDVVSARPPEVGRCPGEAPAGEGDQHAGDHGYD
jgi:hypothetical protein